MAAPRGVSDGTLTCSIAKHRGFSNRLLVRRRRGIETSHNTEFEEDKRMPFENYVEANSWLVFFVRLLPCVCFGVVVAFIALVAWWYARRRGHYREESERYRHMQYPGQLEDELLTAVLQAAPVEKRLEGLSPEDRLRGLSAEELAAGLTEVAGLTEEEAAQLRELLERKSGN